MGSTPLNRFVESFVLPLVAGGRLHVRGLIGPGMLARFAEDRQLDGSLVAEVMGHARALLSRVGPAGPAELLPLDGVALAAVWHNLLSMTHPEAVGREGLRRTVRDWSARMLEWVAPPRTAAEVALRHALLARLRDVGRVDTDVSFWAGSARYIGVAPPARLLAWRTVRRVRETKTRVPFLDLLASLHAESPALDLLEPACVALALSPLTDLSLADRPAPAAFAWSGASVSALADRALRGAMVRLVLGCRPPTPTPPANAFNVANASNVANVVTGAGGERPEPPADPAVRAVEAATARALESGLPPAGARLLVLFHLELLLSDALARGAAPPGHALAWDALARLDVSRAARVVGFSPEQVEAILALDRGSRAPAREAPSAQLLARAGFVEVSS